LDGILEGPPVAWRRLIVSSRREGTAALLERHLRTRSDRVPADILAELRRIRLASTARHLLALEIVGPLLRAARAAGLRIGISKGFHWAERLYPQPGLRPYLDVDLLVRPAEWRAFLDLLDASGFRSEEGRGAASPGGKAPAWAFSPTFRKDGLAVEVHPNPFGLQIPSSTEEAFWGSLREEPFAGGTVFVPTWSREFCTAAVHAQQHSYRRLAWLVDLAEMAGRADLDWAEASGLARREGLAAVLAHGLRIASLCWPGCIPAGRERLFPASSLARRGTRFFWPEKAVASRRALPEAPYYMPSIFALAGRGSLPGMVRGLARIFFPPPGWIRRQMPAEGRLHRLFYAVRRLLRPWVFLVERRIARR
jgi:hypothetical protein